MRKKRLEAWYEEKKQEMQDSHSNSSLSSRRIQIHPDAFEVVAATPVTDPPAEAERFGDFT